MCKQSRYNQNIIIVLYANSCKYTRYSQNVPTVFYVNHGLVLSTPILCYYKNKHSPKVIMQ